MAGPWSSAGGGSRLSFKLQVPLRQFAAKRQISSRSFQSTWTDPYGEIQIGQASMDSTRSMPSESRSSRL